MGKPLSLMWCRSCVAAHAPGEHLKRPLTTAPIAPAPRPVKAPQSIEQNSGVLMGRRAAAPASDPAMVGATKRGDEATSPRDIRSVQSRPPQPSKPKKKRKSRPPKDGKFSKDYFQMLYMQIRREADAAGFGGGKDKHHPKYNPNYKTVNEYNAWKAGKK